MTLLAYATQGALEGLIFGVMALGIVLIYKGSRTINFAQPYLGLFTAYVCWYLTYKIDDGLFLLRWLKYVLIFRQATVPRFVTAALFSLALIALLSFLIERDIMHRLERAPRLVTLVATIALAQGFLGATVLLFNRTQDQATELKRLPKLLGDTVGVDVGIFRLHGGYLLVLLVVPLIAAAAAAFFKLTKFGVAIRAAAENRESAQLLGISVRRVSSFTWVVGGLLAGVAALLIVPVRGSLDVTVLSIGLLVRAFAAALVGGLVSLPGALVGGVIVGVGESLIGLMTRSTWWPGETLGTTGWPEFLFFLMVIAVLVFRPGGLFGKPEATEDKVSFVPAIRDLPARLRRDPVSAQAQRTAVAVALMLVSAVSLATGPFTNGVLTTVVILAVAGVSLTVLIGYAGQISLGHFALVGVGAFAAGNMYSEGPIPFLLMIPLVVVVGMLVSLLIGLPALRIRGLYLAIVTISFNIAAEQFIFKHPVIARGTAGLQMILPNWGWLNLASETNRPYFFFCLALLMACIWIAHNFKQTRTGRGFFALRENEKAAATLGVELTRYRLLAFMLSGGMAALAGALYGFRQGNISSVDFPTASSLILVSMVIIGGLGSLLGATLGSFLVFGLPTLLKEGLEATETFRNTGQLVQYFVLIGTGILLIQVITRLRGGLAGLVMHFRDPVVEGLVWKPDVPAQAGESDVRTTPAKDEAPVPG
ncbi:MAG TPA: ABC transporter permease [Actinomycetota bacterium]|nr:ABC transporter permease [Actinomycetota bacterium]